MRKIIFAAVALLGFAGAVPAFADSMQRDGDPSGSWRDPYYGAVEPVPYGQFYTGRSVYVNPRTRAPLVAPYAYGNPGVGEGY